MAALHAVVPKLTSMGVCGLGCSSRSVIPSVSKTASRHMLTRAERVLYDNNRACLENFGQKLNNMDSLLKTC